MFGMDFSSIGGAIIGVVTLIFAAIAVLAPIWLYLCNVYTRDTRDELRETNKHLKEVADELKKLNEVANS